MFHNSDFNCLNHCAKESWAGAWIRSRKSHVFPAKNQIGATTKFDQSSLGALWVFKDPVRLQTYSEDSGNTAHMRRQTWVVTGRSCRVRRAPSQLHVPFCTIVVLRLSYTYHFVLLLHPPPLPVVLSEICFDSLICSCCYICTPGNNLDLTD